jgi:hypothetical protein
MKKKNTKTAEVRIDPKGRKLEKNELYDAKTGRYRYQYTDAKGKRQQVYSWTLTPKDSVPKGRKQGPGESLREKEAIVKAEVANKLNTVKGGMTVRDLAQIHIDDKWDEVAESTRNVYRTCMHLLDEDPFGKRKIRDVTEQDVKDWFKFLNNPPVNADGKPKFRKKGNSTFHNIRGIMRPAFETAQKNRWVLDNPFDFEIGQLPLITPHVARHTYCSKKAKAGINPVHLAYLMGHAETDITLGTYTHTKFEDAVDELKRIGDIQETEN